MTIGPLKFHKIEQIKLEPKIGTSIVEALKEALELSKEFNCQVIVIWNEDVDIYVEPDDTFKQLISLWESYNNIRKERIIVDTDNGKARKIKITGIRNIRDEYSGNKGYLGLLAKDNKNRIYSNNFIVYNDTAVRDPYGIWRSKILDDTTYFWEDIIWGRVSTTIKRTVVKQFKDDLRYCEKHDNVYWSDDSCYLCKIEKINSKNKGEENV